MGAFPLGESARIQLREGGSLRPVKRRSQPRVRLRPLLRARKRGTSINLCFPPVPLATPLVRAGKARHGP